MLGPPTPKGTGTLGPGLCLPTGLLCSSRSLPPNSHLALQLDCHVVRPWPAEPLASGSLLPLRAALA